VISDSAKNARGNLHNVSVISGTIKLNVSRLYVKSDLSKDLNFDASNFVIESCVHEAEEELRLGEMVLSSGDSSIPPIASQALTCAISKMIASAAAAGYRLGNEHQLDSGDGIPTVAAATAVYRRVPSMACD
jgi:hypothetical protein